VWDGLLCEQFPLVVVAERIQEKATGENGYESRAGFNLFSGLRFVLIVREKGGRKRKRRREVMWTQWSGPV